MYLFFTLYFIRYSLFIVLCYLFMLLTSVINDKRIFTKRLYIFFIFLSNSIKKLWNDMVLLLILNSWYVILEIS